MSDIDISSLPISKIRSALKDLGLSGSGTKKELIIRYNEYQETASLRSEEPVVVVSVPEVVEMEPVDEIVDFEPEEEEVISVSYEAEEELPVEPVIPEEIAASEDPLLVQNVIAPIGIVEETSPVLDVEAELLRREARMKRFGGEFNIEKCRLEIINEYNVKPKKEQAAGTGQHIMQESDGSYSTKEQLASRRARFGTGEKDKIQVRRERFGGNVAGSVGESTVASVSGSIDAVKQARIDRFGTMDTSVVVNEGRKRGQKRNGVPAHFRKNGRFV